MLLLRSVCLFPRKQVVSQLGFENIGWWPFANPCDAEHGIAQRHSTSRHEQRLSCISFEYILSRRDVQYCAL
jgi:hypothetical protein